VTTPAALRSRVRGLQRALATTGWVDRHYHREAGLDEGIFSLDPDAAPTAYDESVTLDGVLNTASMIRFIDDTGTWPRRQPWVPHLLAQMHLRAFGCKELDIPEYMP
jgi:hypothetical protein